MVLPWQNELFIDDEEIIKQMREFTEQEQRDYNQILNNIKTTPIKNFFDRR